MTNSNQKERFRTKIAMLEQNNQVLHNKCEEYLGELKLARKALDVAVDALKKYTDASGNWWYGYEFQGHYEDYAGEYADKAIEQITALEQKDVK